MENKKRSKLILVIHNIRSAHNVGALFRTADGAGADEIILSGYTPLPPKKDALYLTDADKALKKTALGAEESVPWRKASSLTKILTDLKKTGYKIVALEQDERSVDYRKYTPGKKVALLVGNEVSGVDKRILKQCDAIIELPMRGKKNSLNVSVAAGIALYQITSTMEKESV